MCCLCTVVQPSENISKVSHTLLFQQSVASLPSASHCNKQPHSQNRKHTLVQCCLCVIADTTTVGCATLVSLSIAFLIFAAHMITDGVVFLKKFNLDLVPKSIPKAKTQQKHSGISKIPFLLFCCSRKPSGNEMITYKNIQNPYRELIEGIDRVAAGLRRAGPVWFTTPKLLGQDGFRDA